MVVISLLVIDVELAVKVAYVFAGRYKFQYLVEGERAKIFVNCSW